MENTRERLLLAAGAVMRRDGVRAMTLQAVAREAAVSKGGLLHHFPSKRDLIIAMADERNQLLEDSARQFERTHADAGAAEAYVHAVAETPPNELDFALLAAVFEDPALLEGYRQEAARTYERVADGASDPILASVVALACDGLWMNELLDTSVPGSGVRSAVISRLAALAGEARERPRAGGSEPE